MTRCTDVFGIGMVTSKYRGFGALNTRRYAYASNSGIGFNMGSNKEDF